MAKASVSRQWFIAVDGDKDFLRQKWMEYRPPSGVVERLFVVSHSGEKGDNPHVHVLLQESEQVQKQSLDARFKKYFNIDNAKTQHYSSKVWDGNASGEGAGSYCFHEVGAQILVNIGISESDVVLMRKANEAVQKVVTVNKQKASCRLPDRALAYFRDVNCKIPLKLVTPTHVMHWMLVEIAENRSYHPGDGRLKSYCSEVIIKLKGPDDLWHIASEMAQNILC